MTQRCDVIVIGAGIAGLSAAAEIAEFAQVVVLEREDQPAYHSSGRSAALYIEAYENAVVNALTRAGRNFYFAGVNQGDVPLVKETAGLTVASVKDIQAFEVELSRWAPVSPKLAEITPEDACALVPCLRRDVVARASLDTGWFAIDVHAVLSLYQRRLRELGAQIHCKHHVHGLDRRGDCWDVTTDNGVFSAPVVVNAAGAWASELGTAAGVSGTFCEPRRRTAVLVPAPEGARKWPVVHDAAGELYFKPESSGLMVSPQDEHATQACDAQPEDLDVAIAMDRLSRLTTLPVDKILHRWAGLRTFAPDRLPVVGFDPGTKGFFWLAGQGGFGVQTAPALSRVAAQWVKLGKRPEVVAAIDVRLADIDVGRFHEG